MVPELLVSSFSVGTYNCINVGEFIFLSEKHVKHAWEGDGTGFLTVMVKQVFVGILRAVLGT